MKAACASCGFSYLETDEAGEWRWSCRLAGEPCRYIPRERPDKKGRP